MTAEPRMVFHLKPIPGGHFLRSITREQLQALLDEKGGHPSRSIVDHLRWGLSNILKTAMSDGLIESGGGIVYAAMQGVGREVLLVGGKHSPRPG